MQINYENILDTLQEELNKVEIYSKTIDISKLKERLEGIKQINTIYDGTDDDLPF